MKLETICFSRTGSKDLGRKNLTSLAMWDLAGSSLLYIQLSERYLLFQFLLAFFKFFCFVIPFSPAY